MTKRDLTDGLVEEKWFANVFDFWDCAFEVESFGEHYFENLDGLVRGGRRGKEITYIPFGHLCCGMYC